MERLTDAEAADVPTLFVAVTVNVTVDPGAIPVTMHESLVVVHTKLPPCDVTV